MQLHEEIGPRATTISAIAERAGVQRLTVYRHFPDETAVFQACTSHWLELNPPPDAATWAEVADPVERVLAALAAFYAYYSATRRMWTAAYRDVADVPVLREPMAEVAVFVGGIADDLAGRFGAKGEPAPVAATIRHALQFQTWSELEQQGLDETRKLGLARGWLNGTREMRWSGVG